MAANDYLIPITQAALKPGISVTRLQLGDPYVRFDGRVAYTAQSTDEASQDPEWPYYGIVELTHKRWNLTEMFDGMDLKIKLPAAAAGGLDTHSDAVADKLAEIFGLTFVPADYYSDAIVAPGSARYTFRAMPNSKRYSGSVEIHIYPQEELPP